MEWLSRPKILFGLLVNAAYGLFCLAAASPHEPPRARSLPSPERYELPAPRRVLPYVPLSPPSGPTKAATFNVNGSKLLLVYLPNDLTLVSKPTHRLYLTPTFSVKNHSDEEPRFVLLHFTSFSRERFFSADSRLTITADGALKWPHIQGKVPSWEPPAQPGNRLVYSAEGGEHDSVVETLSTEISYEDFIEIISARRVVVSLGPDRVELTTDQVEALRDMHRKLPQPTPPPQPFGGVEYIRTPPTATTGR